MFLIVKISVVKGVKPFMRFLVPTIWAAIMISKIPQLRGVSPWILYDFRSPKRTLPGIQDGWNRKGLISQNGVKKKAFFVMKKFYGEKEAEYLKK